MIRTCQQKETRTYASRNPRAIENNTCLTCLYRIECIDQEETKKKEHLPKLGSDVA